jgi:hypothetical protein
MQLPLKNLRRSVLPLGVFAAVLALHYAWTGFSLQRECAAGSRQTGEPCCEASWWAAYVEPQNYWLGYSYGLSLAFAGVALRRYREQRLCAARNLAIGGVTLSGFLAVAGCFLAGCCGSPMLGVYLSLFGASFLPWAKPLVAALTTVMIAVSYWWMKRQKPARPTGADAACACNESGSKNEPC